jgi:Fanconi anemia group M protein
MPAAPASVPKIIADERERSGIIGELKSLGADVEVKTLPIGDFITSERTVIERKTRNDFESSILDGRLFNQCRAMAENFGRAIMVIEGGQEYETRISRAALLGAYSSLVTDFGISLFFTRSLSATAELVFAIAKHEQIARKPPASVYAKRKALTLASQQRAIIESLPNVGPTLARKLLDYFYTVENVITAPESELLEVDKMGGKKAKELRRVITQRYKKEDDA